MFAPKVAKPHTKAATDPTNSLGHLRSTLMAQRHGQQALTLQRAIGNQATLRLLAQRPRGLTANETGDQREQDHEGFVRKTPGPSWDFSRIPIFPPDLESRPDGLSSLSSPRVPGVIQPKLLVGQVDNPLEHEADRVADQVMRMPSPDPSTDPAAPRLSRKCAACEDEEHMLQPKSAGAPKADAGEAPEIVHEVLNSAGRPLDLGTRAFFEPRFGHDFARVRIHADGRANESARALGALAYTVGSHIVFASPEALSSSTHESPTVAHELVHIVQQEQNGGFGTAHSRISRPEDSAEREAERLTPALGQGKQVRVREVVAPVIQRQTPQTTQTRQTTPSARDQALDNHVKQQDIAGKFIEQMRTIPADPAKDIQDPDNLLHNALEWISPTGPRNNPAQVAVSILTPTDDATTRDPRQGDAYFDPTVKYPSTGGTYPADPSIKINDQLKYRKPNVQGEFVEVATPPYIALYAFTTFEYDELREVIIHEVQHVADRHKPGYMFIGSPLVEHAKEIYKTEFRSFWIQPEPPLSTSPFAAILPSMNFSVPRDPLNKYPVANPANCTLCPQQPQSAPTHFKNQKQQNIFEYLTKVYTDDKFDCFYVCDAGFRSMVDDYSLPESVNLAESVRIQAVLEVIQKINPAAANKDDAMFRLINAASKLDNLDRQFLQDDSVSGPFWQQVKAHVPADWLDEITELLKFGKHGHPGDYEQPRSDVKTV